MEQQIKLTINKRQLDVIIDGLNALLDQSTLFSSDPEYKEIEGYAAQLEMLQNVLETPNELNLFKK